MSQHIYRGNEPVLSYRDYMRKYLPNAKEGMVVEDFDCVINGYGKNFGEDKTGKFMILEFKLGSTPMSFAQESLYCCFDSLLRAADPEGKRYKGFFLVHYSTDDFERAGIRVNFTQVDHTLFQEFLQFKTTLNSYTFQTRFKPTEYKPVV